MKIAWQETCLKFKLSVPQNYAKTDQCSEQVCAGQVQFPNTCSSIMDSSTNVQVVAKRLN